MPLQTDGVNVSIPTGGGNFDVTVSGIGTPIAAILHFRKSDWPESIVGIGITDGTTSRSVAFQFDGSAARTVTGNEFGVITIGSPKDITFVSWITDGVRLNFAAYSGSTIYANVTFLYGSGASATVVSQSHASDVVDSETTVTTGIDQDFLFCILPTRPELVNWNDSARMCVGFAERNGGQASLLQMSVSSTHSTYPRLRVLTFKDGSFACNSNYASAISGYGEITSWGATSFGYTPRLGNLPYQTWFLAVDTGGLSTGVCDGISPTTVGSSVEGLASPLTPAFAYILGCSADGSAGFDYANLNGDEAECWSVVAVPGSGDNGGMHMSHEGTSAPPASNRVDDLRIVEMGYTIRALANVSIDTNGVLMDWAAVDATQFPWKMLQVGTPLSSGGAARGLVNSSLVRNPLVNGGLVK